MSGIGHIGNLWVFGKVKGCEILADESDCLVTRRVTSLGGKIKTSVSRGLVFSCVRLRPELIFRREFPSSPCFVPNVRLGSRLGPWPLFEDSS